MARPKQDVIGAIISWFFWHSNVFGVMKFSYNREKHQLVYNRKTVIYCIVLHSGLLIFLPISIVSGLGVSKDEVFEKSPIAGKLNVVLLILNALCICISLISQWTCCRSGVQRHFNELNGIWFDDLANWEKSSKIQRDTIRLVCVEVISTVFITIQTFYSAYTHRQNSLLMLISVVYFTVLLNISITGQFQFIMGMLYSGYMFKVLNYRLAQIVEDIQFESGGILGRKAASLSEEVTKIGRIHADLLRLSIGIKDLYQYQFLIILMTYFFAIVNLLFYLSVIFRGLSVEILEFKALYSIGATILCIADLWIKLYICGVVVEACDATGETLRVLSEKENVNTELEKSIEMLSFQLMREKMKLTICGMFDLDGRTGFAMTKAAMMNLILLLQIDYDNF